MFDGLQRIQILSIFSSIVFLLSITGLIKRKMLKEAYAIIWLLFGILFLTVSCWKNGMDYFAKLFGIYYPPALLFLILIVALVLVLIQFSIVISAQSDKIKKLAQELALLKNKIDAKK